MRWVVRAIPVLAAMLEVFWAYPWLSWLGTWPTLAWPRPPLTLVSALALVVMAEEVSRFTLDSHWSLRRMRLITLALMVAALVTVVRLELGGSYALWDAGWVQHASANLSSLIGGFVFGAYLLWRGISVGREPLQYFDAYPRFLFGLAALVALLVVRAGSSGVGQGLLASSGYIIAYFFIGLLTLALINLRAIRENMLRVEGMSDMFTRRWLSLLLVVILAIVLVSVGVATFFSFDLVAALLHLVNTLAGWLLIALAYVVGYPVGIVVAAAIYATRFLLHLLGMGQAPGEFKPPDLSDLGKEVAGQQSGIPDGLVLALKWGLAALAVALVLFILARALLRYWKGKREQGVEEVTESLWSWQVFKADLRLLLRGLVRPFRGRKQNREQNILPRAIAQADDAYTVFTVREIYRGLLWEGRRLALPRRPSETPYDYEHRLETRVETAAVELRAISEAYVEQRYGDRAIGGERLEWLNRLWRSLRSSLRDKMPGANTGQPHLS